MKNILLLSLLTLLTGCFYETEEKEFDCADKFSFDGIESAKEKRKTVYKVNLDGTKSVDEVYYLKACKVDACKPGFTMYSNVIGQIRIESSFPSYSNICLRTPNSCEKLKFKTQTYFFIGSPRADISHFYSYEADTTSPGCTEEPAGCSEGFSPDNSSEDPVCVATVTDCTEAELGAGGAAGTKTWDTETNMYGACNISSCKVDYSLVEGSCVSDSPEPVMGCMDSRAANYNPLATQEDMSCMCDGGVVYNPMTGCDEEPMGPF